ncbi:GxxExxY protein [Hymenobacter sp. UV11]|uniref:GxxExxY protein n=1 Tax=Hymenobacter sp. UV11 TaxID=1849735 RepID=UPI00105DF008|nr:GxxExxY protein [Hymenobacter sp. UV11]TDN38978.1 GxxExxY protein [Hymenobacter sp. UV11]TFZ65939.1 GxxExxY protein [Hymenobacter sp. UV11]
MTQKHENDISYLIRKAAYTLHTTLGPGLLESVYETLLTHELRKLGLDVKTQVALPVVYDGLRLENGFRMDLLVENKVVVELKSVEVLLEIHHMQLLTYLRLSGYKLGLLINFNVPYIKSGIFRKVNGLEEQSAPSAKSSAPSAG